MANINKHNVSKVEKELVAAYGNLITFGKLFLSGDFSKSASPSFHYEIGKELISHSQKPCAMIIARSHAKSTLIKAKIVYDLCFAKKAKEWGLSNRERDLFLGWVSSNQKKSKNNVAYVRLHLEYNEKINYYFGKNGSLRGPSWNQEDLVTVYGDRLVSSSNLTSMRGDTLATLYSGAVRYTNVFVDDAENEENTRTQTSREKIIDNIMNGILPAIEKNEPGARLFLVGTPVHWDAFAQQILDKWEKVRKEGQEAIDKYTWKVITYGVTQPDREGGVLWNSWLSRKKLDEIKQTYIDSPRGVGGYYQEYELQVQSQENALWTRKHIKYWDGQYIYRDGMSYLFIEGTFVPVNVFIGVDPATDIDTKYSDYSVIMAVAVDISNNVYVLSYERHRSIPTVATRNPEGEIIDRMGVVDYIVDYYNKYHFVSGAVEDVAMNRSIFQSLNAEKRRLNLWSMNIVPEKPGGAQKHNRIYSGLNSRVSAGALYFKESHFDLIDEFIKFGPKLAHDDCIKEDVLIKTSVGYKRVKDIKVGDEVLTHRNRYKPVSKVFEKDFDGEFVTLNPMGQLNLDISSDHKMYCAARSYENKYQKKGDFDTGRSRRLWVEAGNIKKTYKNVINIEKLNDPNYKLYEYPKIKGGNPKNKFLQFDKDFAKLLGYFLAEGHAVKNSIGGLRGYCSFASHTREVEYRDFVKGYLDKYNIKYREKIKGNSAVICFHSVLLHRLFRACYADDGEKIIPGYAYDFGIDLKYVLEWWVKGDGWKLKKVHQGGIVKNGRPYDYQCGTTSMILALEMRDIILSLGQYVVIRKLSRHRYEKKTKDFYQLDIFYEKPYYGKISKFSDGNMGSAIKIENRKYYSGKVYDLQVEDDHSFIANGFVVHNCLDALFYACRYAFPPDSSNPLSVGDGSEDFTSKKRAKSWIIS